VSYELEYVGDSTEANLTFNIKERDKVKVEEVVMNGNVRVEAGDLIGKMRNRKRGFLKTSDFAQDKYEEDLEKVINEYHKRGFIDAHLLNDSMAIDTNTNRMTIFLDVYEGPLYYFGNVTFAGNEELDEKPLRRSLKFSEWDEFNSEKYDESLYELYSTYQEIGHLHAMIYDDRVTRNDSLIDITYNITEGLPSHINLVRVVGNNKTKDKVIRREISSLPGQVFSRALLIRSVRDVMALNYFTNVMPEPVNLPNGDVDLEFKVEEKQTAQISAGAGYNSQDKLVGTVGMGIPNFRGVGQSLSFNIEFGSNRNSFSLSFTEPWAWGRPTLLGTDLYSLNRRWYDEYTEQRQGASIRLGRRLRWPDNYFRLYTSYRLERNRYHDYDSDYVKANSPKDLHYWDSNPDGVLQLVDIDRNGDGSIDSSEMKDRLIREDVGAPYVGSVPSFGEDWRGASRLTFQITRDSRNLPEFATKGSLFSYTFSTTGGLLGGFYNYRKHELKYAHFFPLFWKFALAAKVQYGVVAGEDDKILLSDRFNPGGTAYDGIIRGYADGVLTPDTVVPAGYGTNYLLYSDSLLNGLITSDSVDGGYTRVRGKYMFVSNIELQLPILENQFYALAFFDAGGSWLHFPDFNRDEDKLYRSYGFGFRLMVPGMGTLGFDFGKPLVRYRDDDLGWRSHFQIGTTFR
jgi:outer membrane protein insertion porin family